VAVGFSERLTGVAYRLGWTLICRVPQAWAAWVFAKAAGIAWRRQGPGGGGGPGGEAQGRGEVGGGGG